MMDDLLIGKSASFQKVLEEIHMVAGVDCSVLIEGETGTGKELVAKAIHDASPRQNHPFVALNCAAIPAALLESELFGHEKGAFTGAVTQTAGRFLSAHGGTLFLDEIGDMPIELQPKLLRVLQDHQFERLGSSRSTHVDVRVIAATNVPLEQMVEEKKFRADLYYRLNVFPLQLPPLRERKEDIPLLIRHFVAKFAARFGKRISYIPDTVMALLARHSWPGNIRELQNFVERSVILTTGHILKPRMAELQRIAAPGSSAKAAASKTLREAEREHILTVLAGTNGVIGGDHGAAARLGLPRTTLISRMRKLGISSEFARRPASFAS